MGLRYKQMDQKVTLEGFADADYAASKDTRSSTTSYVFTTNGDCICWKSQLQSVVSLSTTEAEFMATTEAFKEAIWLQGMLQELKMMKGKANIYSDSQSSIHLCKNSVYHEKSKHIDIRLFWIREKIEEDVISLDKIGTEDNPADIRTKVLPVNKFKHCLNLLNLEIEARTKLYTTVAHENPTAISPSSPSQDDICKSMVESQGYSCEQHQVITEDGYILGLQRIPVGRSGKKADKPPVLLQHGIFSDGVTWVLNSPEESLAFVLAENGYDVWLGNTRGTVSSRGHQSLTPNDPDYWNWSWDQLAAYDLPAFFQYVHDHTGQNIHYVGHSLGTLMAFAAFSQDYKVSNMLRSAALLSPIAYLNQIPSILTKAAADLFLGEQLYWLGLHEFIPKGQEISKLVENICNKPGINCSDLLTAFTGSNCCINTSTINVFLEHEPQPTATRNLIHLAQMIRKGTIAMYDYGNVVENMKKYGKPSPPSYNMSSIPNDIPLLLSYGGKDQLSDVNDVNVLLEKLKDHDQDKLVVQLVEDYAHLDFVMGVNANKVVYDPLMDFFGLH
ncbi:triacylglycerol lipase 2-like [Humulus lupulus]|uniref:triacylglycerol lipase 2-like n=1 Tax=Humulus lupulus TaxID=3486 RepID=UPI002B418361|nr:triacylglycerol lipase 2-like [Humulus lupulus]